MKNELSTSQKTALLKTLKARFEKHTNRHKGLKWEDVQKKLETKPGKLWSLNEMEKTGGEPDVVDYDKKNNVFVFYDCAVESPKERRSYCYDRAALDSRKANKPKNNVEDAANSMGVELLTEEQYLYLQKFGPVDTKTSSWVKTPLEIRKLGGAIFCDYRFGRVFVYHNGAESYYAGRAFRALLKV